ncbi:glycoside hydrolase family 13 protein [Ulvibacterium marinum]|uniref:Alpha-glucosidase n=1 Tax=Ulvibacterium marinum TaxID=2419782 RepID=A0A3B0C1F2_9FLAO|nr:alpha-glucosidase [Ulvibacterium marinum]RKN78049.1 alpha-glucosidase [Ulvibacterium marinum]
MEERSKRKWWKEGIVYQIYPRSFQDTTGNGIGDLRGIIQRLDYIKSLGVDIVWLNPIYKSPNDDHGYDISDYRGIMEEFGTMADFDELLKGMKQRGLKLVMDLVVNHSSDEHPWFMESRKSCDNPYRDYYHWWPEEKGKPPKRWSFFDIEENAWKYDPSTKAYYLHCFSEKQPDLNWENPKVRQEIYDLMKFWFDKGVDGFRMDVISFISKDTDFPELPEEYGGDFIPYYANGPRLHEYLHEMNKEVLSNYDVMTVGEGTGISIDRALDFVNEDREELNMFFHFDLMDLDREPGQMFTMRKEKWKLTDFKRIHSKWDSIFALKGWGSIYLNNHDFPRAVSRWGNDSKAHWHNSATMLHTFVLTMRGTPYFLYGEEIGMTNIKFDDIEDYRDINTLNRFETFKNEGGNIEAFIQNEKHASRDNARTPMQWDFSENAGFTCSKPWIGINKNHQEGINVMVQESEEDSVLNYFRRMIGVRKSNTTLIYGDYTLLAPQNEDIYAYTRSDSKNTFLVLLSFSIKQAKINLKQLDFEHAKLVISNDKAAKLKKDTRFVLEPYQAVIYQLH